MELTETTCCALHILKAGNEDSLEDLRSAIDYLRSESKKKWSPEIRGGAPTISCMVVMPYEKILESNLQTLGFKRIDTIKRRNGYPKGEIREYRIYF